MTSINAGNQDVKVETDDIDHLGNRRVRGVGELLVNQMRIGLSQMARMARDPVGHAMARMARID